MASTKRNADGSPEYKWKKYRKKPRYSLESDADFSESDHRSPLIIDRHHCKPSDRIRSKLRHTILPPDDSSSPLSTGPMQNEQANRRRSTVRFSFSPVDMSLSSGTQNASSSPQHSYSFMGMDPAAGSTPTPCDTLAPNDDTLFTKATLEEVKFIFARASDVSEYFDADEWHDPPPTGPTFRVPSFANEVADSEGSFEGDTELASTVADSEHGLKDPDALMACLTNNTADDSDQCSDSDSSDTNANTVRNSSPPPHGSPSAPSCRATYNDTVRVKAMAIKLNKYDDSNEIIGKLLRQVERMAEMNSILAANCGTPIRSLEYHVQKLRSFLYQIKTDRVQCGEDSHCIAHELEWADWLLEAAETDVMHTAGPGCTCDSEWALD